MHYELISDDERIKYAPELVGTGHIIVKDIEKFWLVKHKPGSVQEEKRDLLAYLLGRSFANVSEVKILTPEEHQQLCLIAGKGADSTPNNTFLVRLGGSYSLEELPCKTLDAAAATELVFSTWIRRRDAHGFNRIYIQGIPIFFDHQTAFLGERNLGEIGTFFQEPPSDPGRASAWRIVVSEREVKTENGRNDQFIQSAQFIHNPQDFDDNIELAKEKIYNSKLDDISQTVKTAGFSEEESLEIVQFLKNNQQTLDSDIELMKTILLKPFYLWNWIKT